MCVQVVAGILMDAAQKVLIAKRPEGKTYAGYWEFSGGKIEAGESHIQALVREFREELGIDTQEELWQPFGAFSREQEVTVHFYLAQTRKSYQAEGLEGQEVRWVRLDELSDYRFPEPNTQMLAQLQRSFS